jgi:glyceraldehyde 3-phosphate dehydrogenase
LFQGAKLPEIGYMQVKILLLIRRVATVSGGNSMDWNEIVPLQSKLINRGIMAVKIGINGLGRIGKLVFRLIADTPELEVVHINDKIDNELLIHLLRYDTVHGRFRDDIVPYADGVVFRGREIRMTHEHHPSHIPWSLTGAEMVVESSGKFKTHSILRQHIHNGVKKVILTCPADDRVDRTVVLGVNEHGLSVNDMVISNASCTTNCVAMMLRVLHEDFGIDRAFMNTVHPFTNNQSLLDGPHGDFRRARAAVGNIIPTTTSAIRAIPEVMPEMKQIFDGFATRVPVLAGSFVELTALLKTDVNTRIINNAFKTAARHRLNPYLAYCEDPLVSSDIIGHPASAIFDSLSTKVIGKNFIQILAWYDNESGYANRIIDLLKLVGKLNNMM